MKTDKNNSSNFWNKLDKGAEWAEKGLAVASLPLTAATLVAPNPITGTLAVGTNLGSGAIDLYQGIRSGINGDWGLVTKNGLELLASLTGSKLISNGTKWAKLDKVLSASGTPRRFVISTIGRGKGKHKIQQTIEHDKSTSNYSLGAGLSFGGNASSLAEQNVKRKQKGGVFYLPKFQNSGILPDFSKMTATEIFQFKQNSPLFQFIQTVNSDQGKRNSQYSGNYYWTKTKDNPYEHWEFIRSEEPLKPMEQEIAEYLPGTGDAAEVVNIGKDVSQGNIEQALLASGLLILPGNINKIKNRLNAIKLSLLLNNNIKKYNISPSRLRGYKNLIDEPLGSMWNKDTHLYDLLTGQDIGNLSTTTGNYRKSTIPSINQVIGSSKVNHVSQDLYNTRLLQSSNGLISGESLVHPEITERVWKHFPFTVIGNYGLRNENKTGKVVNLNRATEYLPEIDLEHFKVIE